MTYIPVPVQPAAAGLFLWQRFHVRIPTAVQVHLCPGEDTLAHRSLHFRQQLAEGLFPGVRAPARYYALSTFSLTAGDRSAYGVRLERAYSGNFENRQ